MSDFNTLVKARRSANKFLPGLVITAQELDEIFQLVKYAPSAFNLQHAYYVVVTDPARKERLYEAANKQYKVKTASEDLSSQRLRGYRKPVGEFVTYERFRE